MFKRALGEGSEAAASTRRPLFFARSSGAGGWTLIELVITLTVLTILTLGVIPIVRTSVRRQKEQRLRETLRSMRDAIEEFHRDTVGMQCGPGGTGNGNGPPPPIPTVYIDPRSRVVLADCKLFGVDNPEHYPPDLQTLVDGVDVVPRENLAGMPPDINRQPTENGSALIPKKKHYLREIPIDPITGDRDWCTLSSYDEPDQGCSASAANVFDVRSKAKGEALNGEKYSDW
jgi:general secretion pathway protein G